MPTFTPPNYREIEKNKWIENTNRVVSDLNAGDETLSRRIDSFVDHSKFNKEEVEWEIRNNDMVAALFAKTPSRQSLHSEIDIDWLKTNVNAPLNVLSKYADYVYCIAETGEIQKFGANLGNNPSRSLDFYWEIYGYKFYGARVFAREGGGAQKRGHRDLQRLLHNFRNATDPNIVLIAIANGEYYNNAVMSELQNLTRKIDPRSFAVHIEEVPIILEQYKS